MVYTQSDGIVMYTSGEGVAEFLISEVACVW